MSRGIPGSTPGHGTPARYSAGCRCAPCSAATARRQSRYRLDVLTGNPHMLNAVGTRRRIQALSAIGWTYGDLAERLGVTRSAVHHLTDERPRIEATTARRITALYDRLSMTPGPSAITRARALAAGWPPPLAWDDDTIDDPTAKPSLGPPPSTAVDEVAIRRAMTGHRTPLTRTERRLIVTRLAAQGISDAKIAHRCSSTARTILRDRQALNIESRYTA